MMQLFVLSGELADGQALDQDGEEDDDLCNRDEGLSMHGRGYRDGEGYGEAAAEAAPGEEAEGVLFKSGMEAEDADG